MPNPQERLLYKGSIVFGSCDPKSKHVNRSGRDSIVDRDKAHSSLSLELSTVMCPPPSRHRNKLGLSSLKYDSCPLKPALDDQMTDKVVG